MTSTPECVLLDWDTEFFGRRIARLGPSALTESGLSRVIEWCTTHRIDCLYVLSDSNDARGIHLLEDAGARVVDVRMTFDRSLDKALSRSTGTARISRESDIPLLRELAGVSHKNSRFWADEHFPRALCAELYATWIEKSCRGWADRVFVAETDGKPAAYLSCHVRDNGRGEIGLVAVAPFAQGRGLGGALLDTGLAWFAEQRCNRVTVATQGRNAGAQRLYQSRGFLTASVQVWHHLWFTRGEVRS